MPRRARIIFPGCIYHVTQRGNHRQKVFLDDNDRMLYLKYIQTYSRKYGLGIYAYCMMDNHVHFIVRPQNQDSMARTFQVSHQRYALYVQRRNKMVGHLWQGRFFSCLLQGTHLKQSVKYVENNPVRAKMVNKAWEYRWSSVGAHLGKKGGVIPLGNIEELIQVGDWKQYLTRGEKERFVRLIRTCTFKGRPLGARGFIKALESQFKIQLLPNKRGRPRKK